MFSKIKNLWNNYGFEIILGLCVAFIIIVGLYRKITKKKGSWSEKFLTDDYIEKPNLPEFIKQKTSEKASFISKGESECKRVLENIFNLPFNKDRPHFLSNPVTGGNFNLEIDCYNSELGLGVEYNGIQHYKYVPYFHKNKEHFMNQKYRDELKRRMCRDNNIILIEVPHTVKIDDIEKYLRKELIKYYNI